MSKAISPDQVGAYKAKSFPDYVFEAFNEQIAANFTNGSATVLQKDVVDLIISKANADDEPDAFLPTLAKSDIFSRGYLNVEEVYRDAGWKVSYDKPAYYESYDANFTFKAK